MYLIPTTLQRFHIIAFTNNRNISKIFCAISPRIMILISPRMIFFKVTVDYHEKADFNDFK